MDEARALIREIEEELADVDREIREHPYPGLFEEEAVSLDALTPYVAEEFYIAQSDLRSFAKMTQRFGEEPDVRDFFFGVYRSEARAVDGLFRLADRLGHPPGELKAYEPHHGAFGYAAYVGWCALYATAAEVAAALLVNFAAWGHNCGRISRAVKSRYGLDEADTVYMDVFAELEPFEEAATAIVRDGLDRGVPARKIRRACRLFQDYEKQFWDTCLALARRRHGAPSPETS